MRTVRTEGPAPRDAGRVNPAEAAASRRQKAASWLRGLEQLLTGTHAVLASVRLLRGGGDHAPQTGWLKGQKRIVSTPEARGLHHGVLGGGSCRGRGGTAPGLRPVEPVAVLESGGISPCVCISALVSPFIRTPVLWASPSLLDMLTRA